MGFSYLADRWLVVDEFPEIFDLELQEPAVRIVRQITDSLDVFGKKKNYKCARMNN